MSRRTAIAVIVVIALLGLGLIYGLADPAHDAFFPRCALKALTGYDCPGCGSQRALHALLHGQPLQAWHYNAALMVALPLMAILAYAEIRRHKVPRLYNALYQPALIVTIGVAIIAWWIGRNVL